MIDGVNQLLKRYPQNARLAQGIPFKKKAHSSKNTSLREVLILSSHGLNFKQKKQLMNDYRDLVQGNLLSFSVWEKSTHLFLQLNGAFYDFGFWVIPYWFGKHIKTKLYRFRKRKIRFPSSRRIEPVIKISSQERDNLYKYIQNLHQDHKKVLGNYYDPGCQITNAALDDNQAVIGHNCTSWITTAPIGEENKCLIEMLGSNREHIIGTNPGWWTHWLLYSVSDERIPLVLYWSPDPMEKILNEQVSKENPIPWDFNRM